MSDRHPVLHWPGKRPFTVPSPPPSTLLEEHGAAVGGWHDALYRGDNLQVLTHLLDRFRGQVDLVYLDPPFDSKNHYRMKLRSRGGASKVVLEETQYSDTWPAGEYLQFVYERLVLARELLRDTGTLYLHCDTHQNHRLRLVLDEVFGAASFRNEIAWCYTGPSNTHRGFPSKHDTIYRYTKSARFTFNRDAVRIPYKKLHTGNTHGIFDGPATLDEAGKVPEDWWADITPVARLHRTELLGYPTQKPEALVERILLASSDPGDLVLDAFAGSGTTLAVAARTGRRFLGADANPAAIQLTLRRLAALRGEGVPGIRLYGVGPHPPSPESEARAVISEGHLLIEAFVPHRLLDRLDLRPGEGDWRELVDAVLVDWDYDGEVLRPTLVDLPARGAQVRGHYPVPASAGRIRLQLTDLLSDVLELDVR